MSSEKINDTQIHVLLISLTWWATVVEVVVAAVAEGMLEYTLDVVKLEPEDRKVFD